MNSLNDGWADMNIWKINVVNNENGSGYERYTNNNSIYIQVFEILFSIKEILIAISAYFNCKHTESQIGIDLHLNPFVRMKRRKKKKKILVYLYTIFPTKLVTLNKEFLLCEMMHEMNIRW